MASNARSELLTSLGALVMLIFISALMGLSLVTRNLLAVLATAGWACSHVANMIRGGK